MRRPVTVVLAHILLSTACTVETVPDADAAGAAQEARTLLDVPPPDGEVRVLVYHDMEGLSGQTDPNTFRFSHPDRYAVGREALMGDLNAVIEGLVAGGADVVHVVDGHGSGNPDPDILIERLHPAAELVSRDAPFDAYTALVPDGGAAGRPAGDADGGPGGDAADYDAVAVVGMHAKTGSRGFASHTFTLGIGFELNGMAVTETELVGYSWGRAGVPVIFASGDDRLRADLAGPMPWVEFAQVKTATSASTADPRPVDEARADLTAGARRAIERLMAGEMKAQRLSEPVTATLVAVPPADVSVLAGVPGVDQTNGRVTFEAADFQAAYDGLVALVGVARTGYASVMGEVARREAGDGFGRTYSDALFERWLDVESGRWMPAPAESPPAEARTYHGYR